MSDQKLTTIKISYNLIKKILLTLSVSHKCSIDELVDYLYNQAIFSYKRKSKLRKTQKRTIKLYLNSLISLGILSQDSITTVGQKLISQLKSGETYKRTLRDLLKDRKDVKLIISAIQSSVIPNEEEIVENLNGSLNKTSITNLLNLCVDSGLIKRMKKVTFWISQDPIKEKILKSLQSPQKIGEFISDFSRIHNQPLPFIEHHIVELFCKGKIKIDKTVPHELLPIIKDQIISEKKKLPINIPLIKMENFFKENKLSNTGEQYVNHLLSNYKEYFKIISWTSEQEDFNSFIIPRLWVKGSKMWKYPKIVC
ncbi:MAG: hypothetical protein ACXAC7_10195 [Candidatus Hodarchaeales archaeon]|jgi:hypothetical protein